MSWFEAANLAISVGDRLLLEDVSLALEPGERLAVFGPSGCGKTTLLRVLSGLIDAERGRLSLAGRSPVELGWPNWRRDVCYLAQRPSFVDESVLDNLRRPFRYGCRDRAFLESRAAALLERLGLAKLARSAARKLSVGEQQRAALTRALLVEPRVLLLDEPTSALDSRARDAVEALLLEQAEREVALVLVSHDRRQAERLCTRTLDLQEHTHA
jgi:ABC-type iron transport system FetAB ATPase subunit